MDRHKDTAPDTLSLAAEVDGAADSAERLPARIERYSQAKTRASATAVYLGQERADLIRYKRRLDRCGEYLLFRHYYTVNTVRLAAARFCQLHLLCPLCAIRRGAKALKAYLDRFEVIRATHPTLSAYLVTFTVKDGPDLDERFRHLRGALTRLNRKRTEGRGHEWEVVQGGVWSYEFKRGSGSGEWHPHAHMIALADRQPDQAVIREEWKALTGDSHMVDVRPIEQLDLAAGFLEVFKYAVKFSDLEHADLVEGFEIMKGVRLIASSGLFRGVDVPADLQDELLEALPYVDLFFRFLSGTGYSYVRGA